MPDLTAKKKRPLWYNLSPLNLPLPGLVSILHRVSGVVLFLGVIAFLYLLDLSLPSESGYAQAVGTLRPPDGQPPVITCFSDLPAHMCAGITHLLLDHA